MYRRGTRAPTGPGSPIRCSDPDVLARRHYMNPPANPSAFPLNPSSNPRLRLERRYRFSASHLYRRPEWSDEENRRRFGKCANLPGHGHNYRLWVTLEGSVDPRTGFVVDLGALDALVDE